MIVLTRLDGSKFVLNTDLVETVEQRPDTTIRLTTKAYYIVKEDMQDVIKEVIEFKRSCNYIGIVEENGGVIEDEKEND